MNIDNSDWHTTSTDQHSEYAAVHIALVFCWLINSGKVDANVLNQWELDVPLDEHKTPTHYLSFYSDGKLRSDYIKTEWSNKIKRIYNESYLEDIENVDTLKVQRDDHLSMPYNIVDSWNNIKTVGSYFESKLAM